MPGKMKRSSGQKRKLTRSSRVAIVSGTAQHKPTNKGAGQMEPTVIELNSVEEVKQVFGELFQLINAALEAAGQPVLPESAKADLNEAGVVVASLVEGLMGGETPAPVSANTALLVVEDEDAEVAADLVTACDSCDGCEFAGACADFADDDDFVPEDTEDVEDDVDDLPDCGDIFCDICNPDDDDCLAGDGGCDGDFDLDCCEGCDEDCDEFVTPVKPMSLKKRILALMVNEGGSLTTGEIAEVLDVKPSTVRGRCSELVKMGLLDRAEDGSLSF